MNVDLDAESLRAAQEFLFGPAPAAEKQPAPRHEAGADADAERRIAELLEAQNARLHELAAAQEAAARRSAATLPTSRPRFERRVETPVVARAEPPPEPRVVSRPETRPEPRVAAPVAPTNGRRVAPRGPDLVLRATGIHRAGAGWQVRCRERGVSVSKYVADSRFGGYVASFVEALDVRDAMYQEHGLAVPASIEAIVDGERVAPELLGTEEGLVVRWKGQDFEVTGDDAEEIATEIALDVFVEFLQTVKGGAPAAA